MKYNNESDFFKIKKYSLVKVVTEFEDAPREYILISSSKKFKSIDLLCVDPYYCNSNSPPSFVLSYPTALIRGIEVQPSDNLLFLISHLDNPHISSAIERLL